LAVSVEVPATLPAKLDNSALIFCTLTPAPMDTLSFTL